MKKKAIVAAQFNWIFVMIVGAIILVFFFGVIQKQRELSEAKVSNTLLTSIESIATGAGVSQGTIQKIELPKTEVNLRCDDTCTCIYSVGQVGRRFEDKALFAPDVLEGTELIMWTLDWEVPFRVTNFVYATTKDTKYFFIYRNWDSFVDKINKSVPEQLNAEFVDYQDLSTLSNRNYDYVKFVFIDIPDEGAALDIHLNKIDSSFGKAKMNIVSILSNGKLIFFDKTSARRLVFDVRESAWFDGESRTAAIFAGSSYMYDCNLQKAISRLLSTLNVYRSRAEMLDISTDLPDRCAYPVANIQLLENAANQLIQQISQGTGLNEAVAALESQNDALLRLTCPTIY